VPQGPYVFAISVVSPFIKFKNASKETIDASDELVEEIRRALMQAGQRLSRHIRRESKAADLERKIKHIEQFGPILVDGLIRITKSPKSRKAKAEAGIDRILGRDTAVAKEDLETAEDRLAELKQKRAHIFQKMQGRKGDLGELVAEALELEEGQMKKEAADPSPKKAKSQKSGEKAAKKGSGKKAVKKTKTAKKVAKKKIAKKKTSKKTTKQKATKKKVNKKKTTKKKTAKKRRR
jgi:DNA topoisomerase-6 subunit B